MESLWLPGGEVLHGWTVQPGCHTEFVHIPVTLTLQDSILPPRDDDVFETTFSYWLFPPQRIRLTPLPVVHWALEDHRQLDYLALSRIPRLVYNELRKLPWLLYLQERRQMLKMKRWMKLVGDAETLYDCLSFSWSFDHLNSMAIDVKPVEVASSW